MNDARKITDSSSIISTYAFGLYSPNKKYRREKHHDSAGIGMSMNKDLHKAKRQKNDEFYTQLADIEKELEHYLPHFRDKVVYCNCDDPRISNFFHYFSYNFQRLGLKKLISACYKNQQRDLFSDHKSEQAICLEYEGTEGAIVPDVEDIGLHTFKGDGDFRSKECIELLKQSDIVVTNPPFSLFRKYVSQLMEYEKKFLIIGPRNAITYKEFFPLIKRNRLWLGSGFKGGNAYFKVNHPKDFAKGVYDERTSLVKFRNVEWFTNLDLEKRHEELILFKRYIGNESKYPKYDNYDAIEVSEVKNIPVDYGEAMGVPITFLSVYNPDQFEIVKFRKGSDGKDLSINKEYPYFRIIVRNKRPQS